MKRKLYSILLAASMFFVSSCELDLLDNPNDVTISSADPNLILNRVQIDVAGFFNTNSMTGQRLTRILNQGANTYETAYLPVDFNGIWQTGYASILADIKAVKEITAQNGFRRHAGIAKTLEAYVLMTLVDNFGDIPYSEALDPNNFNPKVDNGKAVYDAALALLKSAKEDFTAQSVGSPNDFFYGGNYTKWVRLVNTLELKNQLNRRLTETAAATSAINALIAENNLLKTGDDFIFKYGTLNNDPDSRHPNFSVQFPNGGGDYQSNYYMWHMTEAKGFEDPRTKFYFYRQTGSITTNASELRCIDEFKPNHYPQDMVFCFPNDRGFWGRDHLDNQGIPPDGLKRTLFGIYPAGFLFDENKPSGASASNPGAAGAGIQPIMLASYVDFMLAEAVETLGVAGNAKALLASGIDKSMSFVRSWSVSTSEAAKINAFEPLATFNTVKSRYLNVISGEYDAAATAKDRMRVIAREYWLALYGNGVEAYNLYRRTGQPDGMQPGLNPVVGKFPRSFIYPDAYVNRNSNAKQKADFGVKVFWDNNPDGFIN